jgi:hypothetical protein
VEEEARVEERAEGRVRFTLGRALYPSDVPSDRPI